MELRGIKFKNVLGASGVQGFFGEGYWFHYLPFRKPDFSGVTFVSKTATLNSNEGNSPLNKNFRLKHWFPSSVKFKFNGSMLNALRLPNPGLKVLLSTGKWQKRKEPFFISIMSIANSPQDRIEELRCMVDMLGEYKNDLPLFGLQINLSCPNTGHDSKDLIKESARALEVANVLDVPLMPKFAIDTAPIKAVMELNDHPYCDAICVSNTIKFGWKGIDWKKIWGSEVSPLAHLGGGGLSGPELRLHVCRWIRKLCESGFGRHINGGGGIFSIPDASAYINAGVDSVFLGTVATYHPRRVGSIVQHVNNALGESNERNHIA